MNIFLDLVGIAEEKLIFVTEKSKMDFFHRTQKMLVI